MVGISKSNSAGLPSRATYQVFHAKSTTLAGDLKAGLQNWHAWVYKGWYDIVLRYRRTALGPFWLVLTTGTMIACLALIAPILFGGGNPKFVPYMVAGIISWTYLSVCITEMSGAFLENAGDMRSIRLPSSVYVLQIIFRNIVVYCHLLLIYAFVILVTHDGIMPDVSWFLVNLVIVSATLVPFGFILAIACARFRDIQQLVGAVMQIAFLLTPVFWDKHALLGSSRSWVIEYNPLFHLLEMLRAPLLGQHLPSSAYAFIATLFVVGAVLSSVLYRAFIRRVPLWL
jgi:ABC-type polysaccharide/polyol phosphate export permease